MKDSLNNGGSFKVRHGFFTELRLNIVSSKPLYDLNVRREVSVRLYSRQNE